MPRRFSFAKERRLLNPAEFRQVYDQGIKVPCACFVAFCWKSPSDDGPKVGFTTPRALGKATLRNRMKRRLRETIRISLDELDANWRIVWNLRRAALTVSAAQMESEVKKVFLKCKD